LYNYGKKTLKEQTAARLPVIGAEQAHSIAPFSFTDQDGNNVTNAFVKGKICIVSYFFATCKGICPTMNKHLLMVYKTYKGNNTVKILTHTVDPVHDTVQALKAYSRRYEVDANQWKFLTGDKKKLYDMARYSYLISASDDTTGQSIDDDFIHDQQFTLVDKRGRIRGLYDGLDSADVQKLIADIRQLLEEEKQ
jgi:protein SCO1/2